MPTPALICREVTGKTAWGAGPETLRQTPSGWAGHRDFTVYGTRNTDVALNFVETPGIGAKWSTLMPTLTVVSRDTAVIGGTGSDTHGGGGGAVWVKLDYSTPQQGGRLPDNRAGDKYTLIKPGVTSFNRVYDARKEMGPAFEYLDPPGELFVWDGQVKGGRGFQVAIGTIGLEVYSFPTTPIGQALVSKMIRLQRYQMLNKLQVQLPKIYNTPTTLIFGPGELKYTDFEVGSDRGVHMVRHVLEAGPDWFERWVKEDERGRSVGDPILSVGYPAGDFAGLW